MGNGNNMRLSTRDQFRRTGMGAAKLIDQNKIEQVDSPQTKAIRRPKTSHFRGGDRLPSRASKTRDKSKRIRIGLKKPIKVQQQGQILKPRFEKNRLSPKDRVTYGLEEVCHSVNF
jgi:hypothetical protein